MIYDREFSETANDAQMTKSVEDRGSLAPIMSSTNTTISLPHEGKVVDINYKNNALLIASNVPVSIKYIRKL